MTIVHPNPPATQPSNSQNTIRVTNGETTIAISAGQVAESLFEHLKSLCVGNTIKLGENSGLPQQTLDLLRLALQEFQYGQVNIRTNKGLTALAEKLSQARG